jgi:hypothetical protein
MQASHSRELQNDKGGKYIGATKLVGLHLRIYYLALCIVSLVINTAAVLYTSPERERVNKTGGGAEKI